MEVAAPAQIQSLVQELPHAVGAAKKEGKKKSQRNFLKSLERANGRNERE